MGLDATAYETVALVRACTARQLSDEDWDTMYDNGQTFLSNPYEAFLARGDDLVDGIYAHTGETEDIHHSYGGYSHFRNLVAEMATGFQAETVWGMPDTLEDEVPLYRWIVFSDCEGFLGPKTCRRLADEAAKLTLTFTDRWDAEKWETWVAMFNLAADTGCIRYH